MISTRGSCVEFGLWSRWTRLSWTSMKSGLQILLFEMWEFNPPCCCARNM
jgi:hypothetical protein